MFVEKNSSLIHGTTVGCERSSFGFVRWNTDSVLCRSETGGCLFGRAPKRNARGLAHTFAYYYKNQKPLRKTCGQARHVFTNDVDG